QGRAPEGVGGCGVFRVQSVAEQDGGGAEFRDDAERAPREAGMPQHPPGAAVEEHGAASPSERLPRIRSVAEELRDVLGMPHLGVPLRLCERSSEGEELFRRTEETRVPCDAVEDPSTVAVVRETDDLFLVPV